MKYLFYITLIYTFFLENSFYKEGKISHHSHKKGIGLSESSGFGEKQLSSLNVNWYYNWGYSTKITTNKEFIPMVFSKKSIHKVQKTPILLGFNEPDNKKQSHISVEEAFGCWEQIAHAGKIGSPATAGNPLYEESWLSSFMKQKLKVDFITIHWYKGCNPDTFIKNMQSIIKKYNISIWITEFAPQTTADSKKILLNIPNNR